MGVDKRKSTKRFKNITDIFKGKDKQKQTQLVSDKNEIKFPEKTLSEQSINKNVVVVTEEEEQKWLSKNEFVIGDFFNSSAEDREIILQDVYYATPLEIFKFIFSDNTTFFADYHKAREDFSNTKKKKKFLHKKT